MNDALHEAIDAELLGALEASRRGDDDQGFRHLERAHILAQRFTILHVRVHWLMLKHGIFTRSAREIFGQSIRSWRLRKN